ncbi:hypothetical protein T484DRAFT_1838073, partial [Baffinella frigidus]
VYTRDVNPDYIPGSFDKFMVDPEVLIEGGERLHEALKVLEMLQQPECSDLWDETNSEDADGRGQEEFAKMDGERDPEGTAKREEEAWDEMQNSLIHPVLDARQTYVAPPDVQKRYEATVRALPGAITFEDGQPVYPPARDDPPDYPRGSIPAFNLSDVLRNRIGDDENLHKFNEEMRRAQETGMADIFGPWREEFPPVESIPHEWLEDVAFDVFDRNDRGLPGLFVKMVDPWMQQWWLTFQDVLLV